MTHSRSIADQPPAWLAAAPLIFVLLWSTGFIGARLTAPDAEPLSFLACRFAIVALLLAVWSIAVRAPWLSARDALRAAIAGALIHGGYLGSVFWAVYHGMPAGVSALIVCLQPLMTTYLYNRAPFIAWGAGVGKPSAEVAVWQCCGGRIRTLIVRPLPPPPPRVVYGHRLQGYTCNDGQPLVLPHQPCKKLHRLIVALHIACR